MIDRDALLYYSGRTRDLRGRRPFIPATKLAQDLGVNIRTVSRWLSGRRGIPTGRVMQWKLASVVGAPLGKTLELINENRYVARAITGDPRLNL